MLRLGEKLVNERQPCPVPRLLDPPDIRVVPQVDLLALVRSAEPLDEYVVEGSAATIHRE